MRSINTSIVALIPVGAILYVGAVQLGSGSLKDLALALFVGMAAGVYSSVFIAHAAAGAPQVAARPRSSSPRSGRRPGVAHEADRYAAVPAFTEDMPIQDEPGAATRRPTSTEPPAGADAGRRARAPRPPAAAGSRRRPRGPVRAERRRPAGSSRPGSRSPSGARSDRCRAEAGAARRSSGLIVDVPDFPEPGIVFKDITPLLADHAAFTAVVDGAGRRRPRRRRAVGRRQGGRHGGARVHPRPPRSRSRLGAGFVPVRKAGKLPRETYAVSYALEYGEATLELHRDAHRARRRVLLVDDVLATGGTVRATVELVEKCGGTVARRRGADGARLPARPRGRRRPAA